MHAGGACRRMPIRWCCRGNRPGSDQAQTLHAGMTVLADNDVIVHGDAERAGDVDDGFGHLDIGAGWRRVAGRMVVHQLASHRKTEIFQYLISCPG